MNLKIKIILISSAAILIATIALLIIILNKSEKTYGLDKTAELPSISITASEIVLSEKSNYVVAEEGKTFVLVRFIIKNSTEEPQKVGSAKLFDVFADGEKVTLSINGIAAFKDTKILEGTILPGETLTGDYTLEVLKSTEKIRFEVKADWLQNEESNSVFEFNLDV